MTEKIFIVSIAGSINKVALNKNNVVFTSGKNTLNLQNAKGKKITFVDDDGDITKQTFGVAKLEVVNGDGSYISAENDATVITLDASERTENIALIGNSKANTLIGGSGNDELTGGKGKDYFVYNGGDDLITDYTAGQDIIKLDGVSIQSAAYTGELETDLVLTTDKGTLMIENAVKVKSSKKSTVRTAQKITIIDDDDVKTSLIYDSDTLTAADDSGDNLKTFGDFKTIDASKRSKKAIELIGDSSDNTLIGGKKNDKLTGDEGADTFVYTAGYGNDTITDYSAEDGDMIKLGKKTSITSVETKNEDLIFTIGKNKLTLQDAANETVTFIDDNNFKITYEKWSESIGYEERYFIDDNFAVNDLDEIISSDSDLINGDLKFNDQFNFQENIKTFTYNQQKKK